ASGLRMNHAFIRIGGLVMDLPEGAEGDLADFCDTMAGRIDDYERLLSANPIWLERTRDVGYVDPQTLLALGATGPVLRAAGIARDVRKDEPYGGYEQYEFDVPISQGSDCYARYAVRIAEMRESLRIVRQALDSLPGGPVMIDDPKVRWPGQLSVGPDGIGNSPEYVKHIMEESMEALINHFKLVTEGYDVPAGEVYEVVESPRGELGYYLVSDGTNRPYRVRVRDPSFLNLQSLPAMVEGQLVADAVACIA